jgi:hypothetical protein
MLGGANHGVLDEARAIIREEGYSGLLKGLGPRVGWMALGGYIFFGMYEQCIEVLLALRDGAKAPAGIDERHGPAPPTETDSPDAPSSDHVPAHVAAIAGGLAGMVIDFVLYPVDVIKTRTIQGLATDLNSTKGATSIVGQLKELRGLWHGIGAALLPARTHAIRTAPALPPQQSCAAAQPRV